MELVDGAGGVSSAVGAAAEPIVLSDMYPFSSVNDLKRQLWIQKGGDPRWAPERVFIGVSQPDGSLRPLEFHWPASVGRTLPDPTLPEATRAPSPGLVDDAGNRKPVQPTMLGALVLEAALTVELRETGFPPPLLKAFPLSALAPASVDDLTAPLLTGFYQLYFPWLERPDQITDSASPSEAITAAYADTMVYMAFRTGRIAVVQSELRESSAGDAVTMDSMVRLRWVLPPPVTKPESLEQTFYRLPATPELPFLRYFPPAGKGAPILKLGMQPGQGGALILDDPRIMTQYLNQPAPNSTHAVIVGRVPLRSTHAERGSAFTLHLFEDGSTDITLEVPQRGMTYLASVAADAERVLASVVAQMGFPEGTQPLLRDLHATYRWAHPAPKQRPISPRELQGRVAALTPFFDAAQSIAPESRALGVFVWRATSNYESETAQFAFIDQLVRMDADPTTQRTRYVAEVGKKFGLTPEKASITLDRWLQYRGEAVAPVSGEDAGSMAVAKHSTGVQIAISGAHPEYRVEIQGVDSYMELQRVASVVGVLLGAPLDRLALPEPSTEIVRAGGHVAFADAKVEADVNAVGEDAGVLPGEGGAELDPEQIQAFLLSFGGFGAGSEDSDEDETVTTEVAELPVAPPPQPMGAPDLATAVAEVKTECVGTRWTNTEPALRVAKEYYITKLKAMNRKMVEYKEDKRETGGKQGYTRSCQKERQPDIMSLAEYARVKRCYEGRVRFVDLPPQKPSDLPTIPGGYNPKNPIPDEVFLFDAETKLPIWSVLGYQNRTRPGEYHYMMCAELWCERDNLPLLRSEYVGTVGRDGFPKEENTCPFCGGRAIQTMGAPRPRESVIERKSKDDKEKVHAFIGELTRGILHPDGGKLPCCDLTPRLMNDYLKKVYTGDYKFPEAGVDSEGEVAPAAAVTGAVEEGQTDYLSVLGKMTTQYVLGADRTLKAGKIGLMPPYLDAFFGQSSQLAVEKRGINPTFREGASVFVRLGVDSEASRPGFHLFAGLAPLLGFDSSEQTLSHFLSSPNMVRAFESANYGTLVQEFAARSTLTNAELTPSLQEFATKYGYSLETSRPHVLRLYKAWLEFRRYLENAREPKQLRHLEHLLAEPGVLTPRGLLIAALEKVTERVTKKVGGKVVESVVDRIRVICPSFGLPKASYFGDVPVAFLWHDRRSDTWEPIVLFNGTRQAVKLFGEQSPERKQLQSSQRVSVDRWLREWRSASLGCGRPAPPPHVWTPDKDTLGLPKLSELLARLTGHIVVRLVRDRSNRLAGVLMRGPAATGTAATTGAAAPPVFFIPCLDDGALGIRVPRVYEVEGILRTATASLDAYLRYYDTEAKQFPMLHPEKLLAMMGETTQVVGFLTKVGTMIPVTPTATPPAGLPVQQIDAFPWERDALILRAPDASVNTLSVIQESTASVEEQMSEAYQHLRLTFAHWLKADPAAAAFKQDIARLLPPTQLPLYERRKRLDILLEPLLRQWIAAECTEEQKRLPLLRTDCVSIGDESKCSAAAACRWSGGRCLIHAPYRQEGTDPVRIFTARLSDELLRYATQRNELYDDAVPLIRTPHGVVRQGDELYISTKPKESAATVMGRLGFLAQMDMSFPEEMLRFEGLEEPRADAEEAVVGAADVPPPAQVSDALPAAWTEKGFYVPTLAQDLPDARFLAWASGSGYSLPDWNKYLSIRRSKLGVPGDPARPFQWSIQDFYVIAAIHSANLLFVRQGPDGRLILDRWIAPPGKSPIGEPLFGIFWGPRQLLVTKGEGSTVYRFKKSALPDELQTLLDTRQPMPEEQARGSMDSAAVVQEQTQNQAPATASSSTEPPQTAATQTGEGGAMPVPQPAPTL